MPMKSIKKPAAGWAFEGVTTHAGAILHEVEPFELETSVA